ncbi:MAG: hypothetical protein VXY20_06240, partial [Pseudomonadota bacterium]|nr:hypothetical protein [Pseudomonadota bacterium]
INWKTLYGRNNSKFRRSFGTFVFEIRPAAAPACYSTGLQADIIPAQISLRECMRSIWLNQMAR